MNIKNIPEQSIWYLRYSKKNIFTKISWIFQSSRSGHIIKVWLRLLCFFFRKSAFFTALLYFQFFNQWYLILFTRFFLAGVTAAEIKQMVVDAITVTADVTVNTGNVDNLISDIDTQITGELNEVLASSSCLGGNKNIPSQPNPLWVKVNPSFPLFVLKNLAGPMLWFKTDRFCSTRMLPTFEWQSSILSARLPILL